MTGPDRADVGAGPGVLTRRIAWALILPLGVLPGLAALLPSDAARAGSLRLALIWGAALLCAAGLVHLAMMQRVRAEREAGAPGVAGALGVAGAATATSGIALWFGAQRGFAILVAGFGLLWLYEHRRCVDALPAAYLGLRRSLTLAVCSALVLSMLLAERMLLL